MFTGQTGLGPGHRGQREETFLSITPKPNQESPGFVQTWRGFEPVVLRSVTTANVMPATEVSKYLVGWLLVKDLKTKGDDSL